MLAMIGGELYVQAHQQIFVLDPEQGSVLRHHDLAALTGLGWYKLYGGNVHTPTYVRDSDTLLVSFEKRVIAFDAASHRLLWNRDPHSWPHQPLPALHAGVIYLTVGPL